jgi:putative Holliday junction resolvase
MIIEDNQYFSSHVDYDARLLGMDVGSKTIGLAVGHIDPGIASAIATIQRTKFTQDVDKLREIIADYAVTGLVIGMPYNFDGTRGRRAQSVYDFAQELDQRLDLPITFFDERLSTDSVDNFLAEEAHVPAHKRKQYLDKLAAQTILQGFLDSMCNKA